jgi:hypothetical protein
VVQVLGFSEKGKRSLRVLFDILSDLNVAQVDAHRRLEIREERHENRRGLEAERPAVQDWGGLLVDLGSVRNGNPG